jgi:hypothetical protein
MKPELWVKVLGYAGENVPDENEIQLICIPCEVWKHCGMLASKAEKG